MPKSRQSSRHRDDDRDREPSTARAFFSGQLTASRLLSRLFFEHPGRTLGALALGSAATAIVMNAIAFQTERHPAPMFVTERPAPVAAPVPTPPPRPVSAAVTTAPLTTATAQPRDPIAGLIERQSPRPVAAREGDPIAALIKGQMPQASDQVQLAQRALNKLGYGPLKEDGSTGPATRAAIERFERDRRLPPKGEASGRTLKELASAAGLPLE